jgi:8-oxo-dGTP diphosphatase
VKEFIKLPWHAVELYYHVKRVGGELKLGSDPELPEGGQMILEVGWV